MFITKAEGLDYVVSIVEKVAAKYEEVVENNFFYKAKLNNLKVLLVNFPLHQSNGVFISNPKGQEMRIFVSKSDSEKMVAHAVAHEFAHMLLSKPYDKMKFSGKATDDSTDLTAVKRVNPDGSLYGKELEEYIADALANFVVEKLDLDDKNGSYASFIKTRQYRLGFVEKLAGLFGESLQDSMFIDETVEKDGYVYIKNDFWYAIVTFSFNEIINKYNTSMGVNSFRYLNGLLKMYEENGKKDEDYARIDSELNRFKELL